MALHRIGNYELLGELGRGGMGVVYRGVDSFIKRQVAIKTIYLSEIQEEQERQFLRERLYREAQSAGILSHPNIVTIYQIGEQDEITYIAMEFVDGHNLAEVLRKRDQAQVTLDLLASVFSETASALDHAHSKGVIHRDVKPANIIVRNDGVAKITDFGIAKISSQTVTRTGMTLGTPHFMAPEQIQGKPLDGRADQYSLGVVMYEAITGKRPFTADSMTTLIFKIVSDEPDPKRDNPQLSDAVSAVLKRALAKNPDDRFPNCMALAQAFRDAAGLGGAESPGTLRNPAMGRDSLTGTQSLPGGAGGYGSGSVAMPPPSMTGTPSGAYPNTGMPLPPPAGTASVATPMATPIATPISTQTRAPMSTRTPTPGLIPRPDATPASTPLPPVPPMGGPATRTTAGIPPGAGLSQPTWQPSARQATEAPNVSQSAWASTPSAYTPTPVPRKNLWLAPLLVVLGLVLVGGIFGLFRLLRTSPENDDKDKRAAGVVTPVNQGADAALPGGPGNAANGFTANSGSTDTPSVRPAMDAQTGGGTNPTGQPVASNSAVKLPQPPGSSSRPAAPPNGGYPTTSTPPTTAGGTMRPGGSPAAVVKPPAVASPKSPAATKPAGLPGTGGSPATSRSPEGAASPVPGTPVPGAAVPGAAVPATGPGSPNSGSSNPGASPVDANRTPGSAVPAVTTAPRPTLRVPAVYPAAARREGVSGTVGLRALVGVDGVPRNIEVTKGIRSDLDKAASDALARWRFQPGTVDGKPTEARVNVEITFNLVQDSRKPVSLRNE